MALGSLARAILVANDLRDIPGDAVAGKRTLAVHLDDHATRWLCVGLPTGALVVAVGIVVVTSHGAGSRSPSAAPLAVRPVRCVLTGAVGRDLIPVLHDTGRVQLTFTAALALGLALR